MGCTTSQENAQNTQIPAGRYKTLEKISQGKRGQVFKALDNVDQQNYAQKIITKLPVEIGNIQKDATKLFEKIKEFNHKNIAKYSNFYVKDSQVNVIMQLSEIGTLGEVITLKGRLEEPKIAQITKQILEGLQFLHGQGIVHNNLKPNNVLLFRDEKIKIADFGIPELFEEKNDQNDSFNWRNFPYTAPQVVKNLGNFPESDVWSVGCLIIFMLTGHLPFSTLGNQEQTFKSITVATVPPLPFGITVSCESFLEACLQIVPTQRFKIKQLLLHEFITKNVKQQKQPEKDRISQSRKSSSKNIDFRIGKKKQTSPPTILRPTNGYNSLLSQKIVLDNNIITIGEQDVKKKLSSYHPAKEEAEKKAGDNYIMLNNRPVRLSSDIYRNNKNRVKPIMSTEESEWISPSLVNIQQNKPKKATSFSNNIDDFLMNQTSEGGESSALDRYQEQVEFPDKRLRIQTEPSEPHSREYFKKPLKLIKKKIQQKKAEALFERRMSNETKMFSAADEVSKLYEESKQQGDLVRTKSNHEQIVINTELAKAQRTKFNQVKEQTKKKREQHRLKWQYELQKGQNLMREESINMYFLK